MRVDILAVGSQGDVQPCVALAIGLRRAGHRVRLLTLSGFEDLARSYALEHVAIGANPRDLTNTDAGRDWIDRRASTTGFLRGFIRVAGPLIEEGIANCARACRETEALVVSPIANLLGSNVAERLRTPLIEAAFVPPVRMTRYNWDRHANAATAAQGTLRAVKHAAFHLLIWSQLRQSTNAARRKVLDLLPLPFTEPLRLHGRHVPMLCAYSPAVVPRVPDWNDRIQVTGYWFLDELPGWQPPEQLTDFLSSGPAPVFLGFGSTPFPHPDAAAKFIVRALGRAGQRGIVLAGGSGLPAGKLSDDILSLDFVPHGWLFQRVCAAVHHGGAGVTGSALRAGLPSLVVPVFADQPFWGDRVHRIGAGPRPIPARHLTEDNLTAALRTLTSRDMRARASALGKQIRGEDGVTRAVELIERHLGSTGLHAAIGQHAY